MGKGDKRTAKGKIFKGSYGKTRPHKPGKKDAAPVAGRQRTQQRGPGTSR